MDAKEKATLEDFWSAVYAAGLAAAAPDAWPDMPLSEDDCIALERI